MPSEWVKHVQSVYKAKKAKNASYSYKQAMKDAKSTYKRKAAGGKKAAKKAVKADVEEDEKEEQAPKKRRRRKKKAQ